MATGDPLLEGKVSNGSALTDVVVSAADALSTARSLSVESAIIGSTSPAFDGSVNVNIANVLSPKLASGTYYNIKDITVGIDGRISAITTGT